MKDKLLKNSVLFIVPAVIFMMIGVLVAGDKPASEPTKPPDVIIIDNQVYKKDTKGPVEFHHKKHVEEYKNAKNEKIACTECHHIYNKEGKNIFKEGDPVKKCSTPDCHDPNKKLGKNEPKLQIAFHDNCKNCHKEVVKAGLKKDDEAPYKKCAACMKSK